MMTIVNVASSSANSTQDNISSATARSESCGFMGCRRVCCYDPAMTIGICLEVIALACGLWGQATNQPNITYGAYIPALIGFGVLCARICWMKPEYEIGKVVSNLRKIGQDQKKEDQREVRNTAEERAVQAQLVQDTQVITDGLQRAEEEEKKSVDSAQHLIADIGTTVASFDVVGGMFHKLEADMTNPGNALKTIATSLDDNGKALAGAAHAFQDAAEHLDSEVGGLANETSAMRTQQAFFKRSMEELKGRLDALVPQIEELKKVKIALEALVTQENRVKEISEQLNAHTEENKRLTAMLQDVTRTLASVAAENEQLKQSQPARLQEIVIEQPSTPTRALDTAFGLVADTPQGQLHASPFSPSLGALCDIYHLPHESPTQLAPV